MKSNHSTAKIEPCVDKRLKKVFLEHSLITNEDLNKVKLLYPVKNCLENFLFSQNMPEDEILEEIKKCLQELATVNEYNIEETNQLKRLIANDLRLISLKESLEKVDQQVKKSA